MFSQAGTTKHPGIENKHHFNILLELNNTIVTLDNEEISCPQFGFEAIHPVRYTCIYKGKWPKFREFLLFCLTFCIIKKINETMDEYMANLQEG